MGADRVIYNFGESARSYRVPISILSADRQRVVLGITCERNRGAGGDGFSVREYSRTCNYILRHHGWDHLYDAYAIQWIRNYSVERNNLIKQLKAVEKL